MSSAPRRSAARAIPRMGRITSRGRAPAVSTRTGCGLPLDVNDVHVSAANRGFDPFAYLDGIPAQHVRQVHRAGRNQGGGLLVDTHDQPVPDGVWFLYAHAVARRGPVATMIERDADIRPSTSTRTITASS